MPSIRLFARGVSMLAVFAFSGLAVAQSPNASTELGIGTRIGIRFVVALVINLLLGGALVAFDPHYASRRVNNIRDDPGGAFVWGLLFGIGVPIALVILAISIIGLIIAVPGFIALFVIGLVGNAVTVVWIGDILTGSLETVEMKTVAYGALALAIPAAIPILGNLIGTLLGFFGLGVVGRDVYKSWRD